MRVIKILLLISIALLSVKIVNAETQEQEIPSFSGLEFIDQKQIVNNKISEIHVAVFDNLDDEHACIAFTYNFDSKGQIIKYQPPMVGFSMVYKYDDSGNLIDYGWDNRDGSEYFWFSTKDDDEDFDDKVKEMDAEHKEFLTGKLTKNDTVVKRISSYCANIDGYYELSFAKEHKDYPKLAGTLYAHLVDTPSDSIVSKSRFKTPGFLTVFINYITE
ncbi:hypothetical protein [Kangiella sp. M94]